MPARFMFGAAAIAAVLMASTSFAAVSSTKCFDDVALTRNYSLGTPVNAAASVSFGVM